MTVQYSSRSEQERLIAKRLGFATEPVQEQTLVERFTTIASRFSDHEAMKTDRVSLTYQQLDIASARVASAILEVSNNKPVVLIADLGIQAVVGILGILKTGKFYIPLEPSSPIKLLQRQLDAIGEALIVIDSEREELVRKVAPMRSHVINVSELSSRSNQDAIRVIVKPDDLVCVTYSSGSTGNPKGVMQNNRSVMRMLFGPNGLGHWRNVRVAQHASFVYTASLFEMFGPLLSGSTLCPYNINSGSFEALARRLKEFKINCAGFAPTVFRMLCSTLEPDEQFLDIRRLVLGGDAISLSDIELYRKHFRHDTLLVTGFASSETGSVTTYNIDYGMRYIAEPVPVGYVGPGYDIRIVDENRAEVATGEIGEIAVTSTFLSPGYWRNDALTRKKFSPAKSMAGPRTYYTGDRGFMSEDGCLTLAGRIDNLVKINAQMVDLNEVEKVLTEVESVAQAAVVVVREWKGGERLVAHVVAKPGYSPTARSLRIKLVDMLPLFMIPAIFVFTDALPLTKNNKVDRQKLLRGND